MPRPWSRVAGQPCCSIRTRPIGERKLGVLDHRLHDELRHDATGGRHRDTVTSRQQLEVEKLARARRRVDAAEHDRPTQLCGRLSPVVPPHGMVREDLNGTVEDVTTQPRQR